MKKHIEINVVDWKNGQREVAIFFPVFDQMITIPAESARTMAFMLMECADMIEPPFQDSTPLALPPADEEESFFGPYEPEPGPEDEDDDDEEKEFT